MTLEDLRVFVKVCALENLSAAARELGCTQPAVSQHVVHLEREIGTPLLERRSRGVAMTEAGRVLYEGALDSLDSISIAIRQIEQLREGQAGSLGISTGGTTVKHFMTEAVVRFRRRYPKVTLDFQSANSTRRCIEALRGEKADLAFITMGANTRGVEQVPVLQMPWVLVVGEDDPLSKRKRVTLPELEQIHYIALPERSSARLQFEHALSAEGVQLSSSTSCDDWDTAVLLVELGLGQAITPALHGRNLARIGPVKAIPIAKSPKVEFGWAARRWNGLSQVAREFVSIFTEEMERIGDVPGLEIIQPDARRT